MSIEHEGARMSEIIHDEKTLILGENAIGSIEPAGRNLDPAILQDMRERLLSDEFYVPTRLFIPKVCVDGRFGDEDIDGPNAAGGTNTLVVADALTTQRLRLGAKTAAEHAANVFDMLISNNYEVGGHRDESAHGSNCGCAACDKLRNILYYIATNDMVVGDFVDKLGVRVEDKTHNLIKDRATQLLEQNYVTDGADIATAFMDAAGESSAPILRGPHNEVKLVANKRPWTRLNRVALRNTFGNDYQAFNADIWSFLPAAQTISLTEKEAEQKEAGMAYYNVGTALVAGGPSLEVVVRD